MNVTLYTTDCPKCKILENKMKEKGIEYNIVKDVEIMRFKGFFQVPILDIGGEIKTFPQALKWLTQGDF